MKLLVQNSSDTPLYLQLFSQIQEQILSGVLQADECLPSLRLVARELQISVLPVRTAYELLEEKGYIYTVQGKGCFVASLPNIVQMQRQAASSEISAMLDRCKNMGLSLQEIIDLITEMY